jgi:hypothetical protein
MGLAAAYRTKFLKQELIKRNQIRRGDILIGKYKSKRTGEITNKVSFVLDWMPFKGNIAERKLYVFDLDMMHPSILKKLIKKVGGLEFTNTGSFTYHRVKFGMKPRDGGIAFNKYIRDFIQEVKGAWKTYNLVNYKQVKLCDYDYSTMFKNLPPRVTIAEALADLLPDIEKLKEYDAFHKDIDMEFRAQGFTYKGKPKEHWMKLQKELKIALIEKDRMIRERSKGRIVWHGQTRQERKQALAEASAE